MQIHFLALGIVTAPIASVAKKFGSFQRQGSSREKSLAQEPSSTQFSPFINTTLFPRVAETNERMRI
ncbi:Hypothetical protein NTJ_11880 [Nesidiocoris tenuis]|uniref:Uncharacterized protein n=1 Tax=Nesidiocoris tenuis TaxID=355587 RepID=A0ABN7B5E2_9HEMI|nr:Hypothetical protein NTJ_11880 [Nesidiocoris tenuis]